MRDLTVDLLNELFEYDKETGKLYWKVARGRAKVGGEVGSVNSEGYILTTVNRKPYRAHRLVFLMHKGYLPKFLDHINGDRQDNRIENLRPVSLAQNSQNRNISIKNKSGYKGVFWAKATKKWRGQVKCNGESLYLGDYHDIEEAAEVVRAAREELHGNFANHGDQ